jgi:aspartate racemase
MQTKLFGQMTRTDVVLPDEYEAVGKAYQDMAVAGRCEDETRRRLFVAGRDMMARGVDAVALAGTDLLLALDGRDPGFPVVDALEIHAALLADLATDRKTLTEVLQCGWQAGATIDIVSLKDPVAASLKAPPSRRIRRPAFEKEDIP